MFFISFFSVIVPGGFGSRGMEGKIRACQWCRENNKPFLGICLGMQAAVIEFARNVVGLKVNIFLNFDYLFAEKMSNLNA